MSRRLPTPRHSEFLSPSLETPLSATISSPVHVTPKNRLDLETVKGTGSVKLSFASPKFSKRQLQPSFYRKGQTSNHFRNASYSIPQKEKKTPSRKFKSPIERSQSTKSGLLPGQLSSKEILPINRQLGQKIFRKK